ASVTVAEAAAGLRLASWAMRNASGSGSFHHRSGTMSRPASPPAAKSRCQLCEEATASSELPTAPAWYPVMVRVVALPVLPDLLYSLIQPRQLGITAPSKIPLMN